MSLGKEGREEPHFSNAELQVGALASRRAGAELLRIPWPRFRRAYEEYPHWQSLVLWTRSVTAGRSRVPSMLFATLGRYCPRFIKSGPRVREPDLLAFCLLEWVHNDRFAYTKRHGWLDALTFFGVRHPRSQAAWALWEYYDGEWSEMPPKAFLPFEVWEQRASKMKICGEANCSELASAVETCIAWEATALWLRPLFDSHAQLPTHVVSELERRFPTLAGCVRSGANRRSTGESTNWQSLVRAGRERCLPDTRVTDRPDDFTRQVQSHPRYVRLMAYGKHWTAEWPRKQRQHYPSFREWRLAADLYSEAHATSSR